MDPCHQLTLLDGAANARSRQLHLLLWFNCAPKRIPFSNFILSVRQDFRLMFYLLLIHLLNQLYAAVATSCCSLSRAGTWRRPLHTHNRPNTAIHLAKMTILEVLPSKSCCFDDWLYSPNYYIPAANLWRHTSIGGHRRGCSGRWYVNETITMFKWSLQGSKLILRF